ncbi:acetylxylan esterase [Actinoplanes philippinensis]|uniref:Cephalosporin-C deacetylase n=1 Tax=Actinoplanes philippinensis TaxID=35752 RepID=A0A1I2KZK5_9ACTN|nr:acetylxylan esterase [Actinoplanes philippinensis]GIE80782.1 acetylxylan esterase [Actinoplanes philippinensis]SFF71690.1 cephalosporin-C deacetylase [Actinoplanes philippinensis]
MAAFDMPLDQLERYAPDLAEPADFDRFWTSTLTAAAGPLVLDIRPEPNDLALLDCWDVTFGGFGGQPVRAWYTRPAGRPGPLPGIVEFAGYGRGRGLPHERLTWPAAGYAHLLLDNRGQGDLYGCGGDTPDPPSGAAMGGPGVATRGLLSPDDYYYRRLITDAFRAVMALRELPDVDPARIAVIGNSQGGGLALAVAGLIPDLSAVLVSSPFLCHIQRAVSLTDLSPYGEIATYLSVHRDAEPAVWNTLSYVDAVHFARRANAPAHFGIGLRDTVCPPSTGFAAYNHYAAADKTMHTYPYNGHEHGDAVHTRSQLRWLNPRLRPT